MALRLTELEQDFIDSFSTVEARNSVFFRIFVQNNTPEGIDRTKPEIVALIKKYEEEHASGD